MENIVEQLTALDVNFMNGMARIILSILLGAAVGAERKSRGQVAGIRTFALISMGACVAMLLSIYVPQEYMGLKNGDPGRIAAQVITGIGFLGGGAMIQMKGSVRGLTTAAGIWVTAIIGMAVGVGMYWISLGSTALILLVLGVFGRYEIIKGTGQERKVINLKLNGIVEDIEPYRHLLSECGVHLSTYFVEFNYEDCTTDLNLAILVHANTDLLPILTRLRTLSDTRSINLSNTIEA